MSTKLVKHDDEWFFADGHPNSRIHRLAHVAETATIMDAAVIGPFCRIENYAVIKGTAIIGGYARQQDSPPDLENSWYTARPLYSRGVRVLESAGLVGAPPSTRTRGVRVSESAVVAGEAVVSGIAYIGGSAIVKDRARLDDQARVISAHVQGCARVTGNGVVVRSATLQDAASVTGGAYVIGGTLLRQAPSLDGFTHWPILMCSDHEFKIGCQLHTLEDWCRPRLDTPVPWHRYNMSESAEAAIKAVLTLMFEQSITNNTWKRS